MLDFEQPALAASAPGFCIDGSAFTDRRLLVAERLCR